MSVIRCCLTVSNHTVSGFNRYLFAIFSANLPITSAQTISAIFQSYSLLISCRYDILLFTAD